MNDSDLLAATRKVFKANVNDPSATIDTLKVSNGRRKVELTVSERDRAAPRLAEIANEISFA